jgi:hypothetical protein
MRQLIRQCHQAALAHFPVPALHRRMQVRFSRLLPFSSSCTARRDAPPVIEVDRRAKQTGRLSTPALVRWSDIGLVLIHGALTSTWPSRLGPPGLSESVIQGSARLRAWKDGLGCAGWLGGGARHSQPPTFFSDATKSSAATSGTLWPEAKQSASTDRYPPRMRSHDAVPQWSPCPRFRRRTYFVPEPILRGHGEAAVGVSWYPFLLEVDSRRRHHPPERA